MVRILSKTSIVASHGGRGRVGAGLTEFQHTGRSGWVRTGWQEESLTSKTSQSCSFATFSVQRGRVRWSVARAFHCNLCFLISDTKRRGEGGWEGARESPITVRRGEGGRGLDRAPTHLGHERAPIQGLTRGSRDPKLGFRAIFSVRKGRGS